MQVADQAQSLASVECFEPVHYPVPMHAAAAFATPREEIDTAQPAGAKSEPPAAADIARFQSPPIVRSAFADPAAQGVSGRVQQAHDILTGVSRPQIDAYLARALKHTNAFSCWNQQTKF